jgi:taurine dioxygenase
VTLTVRPERRGFGATVRGFQAIGADAGLISELRRIWLDHQVLSFPDQPMSPHDLATFTRRFGDFGVDPFVAPLEGQPHVLEVRREPSERVIPFGGTWHSDWSFQPCPPSATLLHAKEIPPHGGETRFADGYRAFETLSASLRSELEDMTALHSARRPYSPSGFLAGGGPLRSMKITPSDEANTITAHPLVRVHPETGRKALWVNRVYTVGIRDLDQAEGERLLHTLCEHAVRAEFVYTHQWAQDTLCMWDNRCTQHCASGGYDGYRRIMHRTVVAGDKPRGSQEQH